ncbi:tyrosine-type recombinase/integrase [Rhizobium sullae]|uniref:Tyrosine-type recombinase/integrase n=1 Tax=Rhizobium sullae TaxID=50338 RepID=A0ABY5XM41_RHISU|nr:tyrosine-type recombinase/integrase [Rhizobium sullae]UWU15361.1 tyrosine-type recombinase/integrase [Rhizobium sullae]
MSRQIRGYIFPTGKIIDGNLFCFCKFPDREKPLGLRKASATILAGAGATEHQLMAIFGWSDSKMAQHYTKAA